MTLYAVRTGSVALTASTTKSLWSLNPTGDFMLIAQMGISFDATAASVGVAIELYRVVTVGSMAGTAITTPAKVNRVGDSSASGSTTCWAPVTTEPTTVEILADWFIQPFGGLLDVQYPLGREVIGAAAGQRLGLRYVTPAAVTPNVRAYVWYDER